MKKITLFFILITILGCSPDNSGNNSATDPIVGKWKLAKEVFYLKNGNKVEVLTSECSSKSHTEYLANNTAKGVSYSDDSGTCELEETNWEYFNWSNLTDGKYKFVSKISGQSEEVSIFNVDFPTSTTMVWHDDDFGVINGQEFQGSEEHLVKIK
ncbi:hypothetical protein [Flavobacterium sp. CF136]|uniref:hypothetical protein n=1 Tax=Flavobacterium sp. (strain CF136) TaxID=1144313 RepID=UPI0002717C13|nr:hypothetical protein [Flavobacterium sp. CF136]EJL66910.1 hypothetical protein PMI10_00490 [Flavobacterium sp. CF136]